MNRFWKMLAVVLAVSMMVSGCSGQNTAAETTVVETGETESAAAAEQAAEESQGEETEAEESGEAEEYQVDYSAGLDDEGNLIKEMQVEGMTLPDYKNAEFTRDQIFATAETIQEAIDTLMENYAEEKQVTDREIKDGDTVNIDYVGTVDGVAFDGGDSQGAGYDLEIGSHSFIDTFEEQLIGAKPGDQVTVKVTFPENYGNDELNGKAAEFATTINYIVEKEVPELTDEFVVNNLKDAYGFETVDALMKDIRDAYDANTRTEGVWAYLDENTTFANEPDLMTDTLLDNYMNSVYSNIELYGISMEDYLAYLGVDSEEAMREQQREEALKLARRYAICQAICDAEGISADEAAMKEYFGENDSTEVIETYGSGYVKMYVRMHFVAKQIAEMATVK